MRIASTLACLVAVVAACGTSGSPPPAAPASGDDAGPAAGDDDASAAAADAGDTIVSAFDAQPIYFTSSDNRRTVDRAVAFPASGSFARVVLHLALTCPKGGCDPWDRFGSIGVVAPDASGDAGGAREIEIARFVTPFGLGASWDLDVTALRPLLAGTIRLRAFIDTWVGPGSGYGGGWLLSASFTMTPGAPSPEPIAVVPIWPLTNVTMGDPAKPIGASIAPQTIALPAGATSFAVRAIVTGHGQGNADDCGEFCQRTHTITAGATPHAQPIWRADCAKTAVPNQPGTWQTPRAGWCPGADVKPWTIDVTGDVAPGSSATFAWTMDDYANTCRPDAAPDGGACTGCTLGASCAYDGGMHTEPFFAASAVLVAYR